MTDIWIRADSTFTGTNGGLPYNQRPGYLLAAITNRVVHDVSTVGMMLCRRNGFPNTPYSAGLADFSIACVNVMGIDRMCCLGVNDYDNGHSLSACLSQQRQWAATVVRHQKKPWIISPLSTSEEWIYRPNLPGWRHMMQLMCSDRGWNYIHGPDLLDINNPAYWEDGVHPNAAGMVELASNLNQAVIDQGGWG